MPPQVFSNCRDFFLQIMKMYPHFQCQIFVPPFFSISLPPLFFTPTLCCTILNGYVGDVCQGRRKVDIFGQKSGGTPNPRVKNWGLPLSPINFSRRSALARRRFLTRGLGVPQLFLPKMSTFRREKVGRKKRQGKMGLKIEKSGGKKNVHQKWG